MQKKMDFDAEEIENDQFNGHNELSDLEAMSG